MMRLKKHLFVAVIGVVLSLSGAAAYGAGAEIERIDEQPWTFSGVFGTFDENQLQRGYQVYRQVCGNCHGLNLMSFRNLSQQGGPHFSEGQVKALAAEFEVPNENIPGEVRPALPSDRIPDPFPNEFEARNANGGAYPPDLSVITLARRPHRGFVRGSLDFVTAYAEGGVDYLYALLTGYEEAPACFGDTQGKYYNKFFGGGSVTDACKQAGIKGSLISMAAPLEDGQIDYADGTSETLEQYSADVSAFLMWTADPHLVDRKAMGFRVMIFLVLFAALLYAVKRKVWHNIDH